MILNGSSLTGGPLMEALLISKRTSPCIYKTTEVVFIDGYDGEFHVLIICFILRGGRSKAEISAFEIRILFLASTVSPRLPGLPVAILQFRG